MVDLSAVSTVPWKVGQKVDDLVEMKVCWSDLKLAPKWVAMMELETVVA